MSRLFLNVKHFEIDRFCGSYVVYDIPFHLNIITYQTIYEISVLKAIIFKPVLTTFNYSTTIQQKKCVEPVIADLIVN